MLSALLTALSMSSNNKPLGFPGTVLYCVFPFLENCLVQAFLKVMSKHVHRISYNPIRDENMEYREVKDPIKG